MQTNVEELKPDHMWIWADSDPKRKPEDRELAGAEAFQAKFGQRRTVCLLNPLHVG